MLYLLKHLVYTLGHCPFWISLTRLNRYMYYHRPRGLIIVGIYMSSNIYYYTK